MAAGDELVGVWRQVYESPTGARSRPLGPDVTTGRAQQTNPRDQPKLYPDWSRAMNEDGWLIVQHKGGTGSQVHDSSVMTMQIPISYREKANPGIVLERYLVAGDRDTTKIADDPGDDATNFVNVAAFKVTPGQLWALGALQTPEMHLISESTA